jgi:MFS family permease
MKNKEQSMRLATAVLVGGVLMLGVFLGALAFMWFGLGPRFAFEGEGPMASVPWTIGMLLGVELGCLLAGWGATRLAGNRSPMAIGILLGLLVVWGVATWNASRNAATRKLPDGKTCCGVASWQSRYRGELPLGSGSFRWMEREGSAKRGREIGIG